MEGLVRCDIIATGRMAQVDQFVERGVCRPQGICLQIL
jgi:hypothetical protein